MLRPQFIQAPSRRGEFRARTHRGFTLVEILVATVLTLVLMGMVVTVFGTVTEEISNSRATIETADRLRSTQLLLQRDLAGATARMVPPLRPEENLGYFEYIEGPIGPVLPLQPVAGADGYDIDGDGIVDIQGTTLGDFDDVLMFTSRNLETPFRGIANGQSISSPVAEVIWFLRGTTLYRRTLLVAPALQNSIPTTDLTNPGFYGKYDLSARQVGGTNDINAATSGGTPTLVLNTLGDLTKRENRYGHQPWVYPHDARFWGLLGMPTLQECSFYSDTGDLTTGLWPFPLQRNTTTPSHRSTPITFNIPGGTFTSNLILPEQDAGTQMAFMNPPANSASSSTIAKYTADPVVGEFQHGETLEDGFDAWFTPIPWHDVDPQNGALVAYDIGDEPGHYAAAGGTAGSTRIAEDVVLTNVLAFDVKIWDPGAPVLEYQPGSGSLVSVTPSDPGYIELLDSAKTTASTYPASPGSGVAVVANFGAYVDLNYMCRLGAIGTNGTQRYVPNYNVSVAALANIGAPQPWFHGPGDVRSHLMGTMPTDSPTIYTPSDTPAITAARSAVYDTWSTHYEYDGIDQDGDSYVDEGTDGVDNPVADPGTPVDPTVSPYAQTSGTYRAYGVDDYNEQEAVPPYPSPLKGVQITIRVFEPDSRSIREVTIVQDFQTPASGTNYE